MSTSRRTPHLTSCLGYKRVCAVPLPASPGAGSCGSDWLTSPCNPSKGKRMEKNKKGKKLNSILQLIINHMWFPSISRVVPWSPQDYTLALWIKNKLLSLSLLTHLFPFFCLFSPLHHRTPSFLSLILLSSALNFCSLYHLLFHHLFCSVLFSIIFPLS